MRVSDHAMYCTRYESEYYTVDTKARLPVRWMAWESLLLVSKYFFEVWNIVQSLMHKAAKELEGGGANLYF